MSTLEKTSGLIRMFMIDTDVLPGRMDEVPLSHHGAMLGGNGAGKTSVLNLQPVFLGAKMSDVTRSGEHKKSFIEYYLPRETSYIAYEYRNANGEVRSVVLHSDPQKQRLQYRFVRSGISLSMFQSEGLDGARSWIKTSDFDRHLRGMNIQHAERLVTSTQAYRSVIQNAPDHTVAPAEKQLMARLASEYSLTTRKAPLNGVDKLMTHMLSKSASTKSLLGVIARHVSEGNQDQIHLLGDSDRSNISQWPKQLTGYYKIMDLEPEARRASSLHMAFVSARNDLADQFNALAAHSEDIASELEELKRSVETNKAERKEAADTWREKIKSLDEALSESTTMQKEIKRQISVIDDREKELLSLGADTAAISAATIPDLQAEIEGLSDKLNTLTKKGADIALNFQRQREAIRSRSQSEIDRIRNTSDEEISSSRLKSENAIEACDQGGLQPSGIQSVRSRMDDAYKKKSSLQDKISSLKASAKTIERCSWSSEKVKKATEALRLHEEELRKSSGDLKDIRHAMEIAERDIAGARMNKQSADREYDILLKAMEPHAQSLQYMLQKEMPGWANTIGRVIDPAILTKTNLSPAVSHEDHDTIFGLQIDLSKLDATDLGDQDTHKVKLEAAAEICRTCEERLVALEAEQAARNKAKVALEKVKSAADANHQIQKGKLSSARQNFDEAELARSKEVERLRSACDLEMKSVNALIASLKEDELALTEEIRVAEAARKEKIANIRSQAKSDLDEILRTRSVKIASIEKTREQDLTASRKDEAASLSGAGVDVEQTRNVETRISEKEAELKKAKECRNLAEQWLNHKHNEAGKAQLELQYQLCAAEISDLTRKKSEAKISEKSADERFEADRVALTEKTEVLYDIQARVSARLKNKPDFITPEACRDSAYISGAEANLREAQTLDQKQFEFARDAKAIVRKINLAFRSSGGNGSGPSTFLADAENDLGEMSVNWVPRIMMWFDGDHQMVFEQFMDGMSASIQGLMRNFRKLKDLQKNLRSFNKKFRDAIDRNEGFPNISDVDLSIECTVSSEPYWRDLERVHDSFNAWQSSFSDRPSEEFIEAVTDLLAIWEGKPDPVVYVEDLIALKGTLSECGNERRITRNTNLSDISSTGNSMIVHLIVFTALLDVLRNGAEIQFVWAVDEIAAVDAENTRALLNMLEANKIALLTASPTIDRTVKKLFPEQIRIHKKRLYRVGQDGSGIREWIADGQLDYPGDKSEEEASV